jgi:hypothetical protein
MSPTVHHRLGSVVLGALAAGTLYWLGIDVLLSSAVGFAFAVALLLFLRVGREFPHRRTGEGWHDGRWTGVSMLVVNFAALVGVQMLPVPGGYRAAVGLLILLVGFSAYTGGSLAEMERDRRDAGVSGERSTPEGG